MLVAPVGFEPTKIHVLGVLRMPFRDGAIVGTRGGIRTHINWFLRPARLPFRHPRLAREPSGIRTHVLGLNARNYASQLPVHWSRRRDSNPQSLRYQHTD